jgi:hypothetical protein
MRNSPPLEDQIQMTFPAPVIELMDMEASLLGLDRRNFLRTLIYRAMGHVHIVRSPAAPPRDPLTPAKRRPKAAGLKVKHDVRKVVVALQADQSKWLREMAFRMGNMPYTTIITFLVLDWCGINALGDALNAAAGNRPSSDGQDSLGASR